MVRKIVNMIVILGCMMLVSCAAPQFFTITIYESPSRNVRLQTMAVVDEGKAYSHPVSLSEEQMTQVLKGLYVEVDTSAISLSFSENSGSGSRRRAFSDREIQFFAPLFVKGLQQATPEEIVTFFETVEISDLHEATTSGGVFVRHEAVHVVLSNLSVKTLIWKDNAEYHAPYRLAPLDPINPEPGRLIFEPEKFMVPIQSAGWLTNLKGKPWQAAVLYKELHP